MKLWFELLIDFDFIYLDRNPQILQVYNYRHEFSKVQ